MKKKELEMILQKIPTFEKPSPELEQYLTPAGIAADIIFTAHPFFLNSLIMGVSLVSMRPCLSVSILSLSPLYRLNSFMEL